MVSYTENHALLRFGGMAWANEEIWSCGLRLAHLGGDEPNALVAETVATIEDVWDVVATYVGSSGAAFANSAKLDWVELNGISAATGKYLQPNAPNRFEGTQAAGGTASTIPQVACCVTLKGLTNRGPASRGRWYIPYGASQSPILTSTGVIPAVNVEQIANAAGTFLTNLGNIDSGEGPSAWDAHLYGDGIGGPKDSPIVDVLVGNVLDTQRRRRNSLIETYTRATTFGG